MSIRGLKSEMSGRALLPAMIAVAMFAAGCGHKEKEHVHEHGEGESGASHAHSHGDDAVSFSGATHKDGEGITLLDQTRKVLDIQVHEVEERALPRSVRFLARVFSTGEGWALPAATHPGRTLRASGTVPRPDAEVMRPGLPVQLTTASRSSLTGKIERIEQIPGAENEVIVSFVPDSPQIGFGDFLQAAVHVAGDEKSAVVPRQAVVQGADSSFVYVVNGSAYLRTPIKTGAEAKDLVEVRKGLLAGDSVVTRGALDLWLIELRAVKGGQGCCPAPPAKVKK